MTSFRTLRQWFDRSDRALTTWMATYGLVLLRVSVGVVFIWFGALKLVPGLSPAEQLISATFPFLPHQVFVPTLAIWEIAIGVGFVARRMLRTSILLLFLQMPGTLAPIIVRPDIVFTIFPVGLTLEGQYIIKNLVLISAALVIGATVRGGRLTSDPAVATQQRTA